MPPRPSAMKALRGLSLALALAGLTVLPPSEAQAQKARPSRVSAKDAREIAEVAAKLRSTTTAEALAGLESARRLPHGAETFVPLITDVLRAGSNPEVTVAALQALGDLGDRSSASALLPYARHRRPELRVAAIEALAKTGGLEAVFTLRKALGDMDLQVRRAAALGLGKLAAKEAIDELAKALDRGLDEAAPSIARIGGVVHVEGLVPKLPTLSLPMALESSEVLLVRDDLPEELKLSCVARLAERESNEVQAWLADFRKRELSPELARAIDDALVAIGANEEAP